MDRVTGVFLATMCLLTGFVAVVWGYSSEGYPIAFQISRSILFPFLPPLFGSLLGVLAANLWQQRRVRAERERDANVLLKNIRRELDENMQLTSELFDPIKLHFIRSGELPLTEKLHTETWDSSMYSGHGALLGIQERMKIARAYLLLRNYNQRDWENEEPIRRERTLMSIREEIQKLAEESFWPKEA
ncbi:MAG: hypothetical protein ABSG74_06035 [Candidatus Bathyarchaeia archaeon]|jgi:hypothetical protein